MSGFGSESARKCRKHQGEPQNGARFPYEPHKVKRFCRWLKESTGWAREANKALFKQISKEKGTRGPSRSPWSQKSAANVTKFETEQKGADHMKLMQEK